MVNRYFEVDEDFNGIIERSLKGKEVHNINKISTGWTNIVYEVETNEENFFFRFPRDEFWSKTIVKDYEFAKYIYNKTDFKTVQLQLLYDNGRPFSMHSKIPGVPLADKMNELSDEEIKSVSDEIAKFMYQLHELEYNENEIFTINNIGVNLTDFLDELLNVHVSEQDRKFWNPIPINCNKCLVHGDLNSSNVLLDNNNHLAAIIDFGFGGFGNRYDDLARIIGRCPDKFKNEIVKSYEVYSTSKIDNDILDKNIKNWSNIDQGYINYMRTIGIYN